ncbi:uncharacterized protein BDR25DRAFT_365584 [Lindgomyces ingoldianus]|uniref:Uncharacterized protein n=1 Tax=Lindgomyces ingoldianus TaxID=673940 RepID=A0ACB6RGW6_9PLEO|nr:uncharacterized protein BDR25DRAFT_365584 [Lindgomyces ingoldianus]KAF2478367.1 hypothetical protein BDR25DRAFT_365584 [Lindgomyces ingoldianus]
MVSTRKRDYDHTDMAPKFIARLKPCKTRKPNPRKPPADGSCPFLSLPGEIRNHIYKFALTEPGGLHFNRRGGREMLTAKGRCWHSNKLQFVNKQIRGEVKGLGLKHNDLNFTTKKEADEAPMTTAVTFLLQVQPSWFKHMRTIIICRKEPIDYIFRELYQREDTYFSLNSRDKLMDICRSNPNITIKMMLPGWQLNGTWCFFMLMSILLTRVYRGEDIRHLDTWGEDPEFVLALYGYEKGYFLNGVDRDAWDALCVPNFKIFPLDAGISDEQLEQKIMLANDRCRGHVAYRADLTVWAEKAKEWYANGI